MKRDNVNYLMVGSVVLVGFTLMLYALYRLTGGVGENDHYYTNYLNVGGLNEGTPVTYQGYKLGSVSKIEPYKQEGKTHYRVTIMIRDGWKIPTNSVARIYSEGLLAETVINIEEGDSNQYLATGSELQGLQEVDVFKAINSVASETSGLISGSVKPLLDNINSLVSAMGDQVDSNLPQIFDDLSRLVETLQTGADRIPRILNENVEMKVTRAVENGEEMSANLLELSQGLLQTRKSVDALLEQSSGTIKSVDSLMEETQGSVSENRVDLRKSVLALKASLETVADYTETILHNLEASSRHMNEFSREIRDNPGLLLGSKPPREVGSSNE